MTTRWDETLGLNLWAVGMAASELAYLARYGVKVTPTLLDSLAAFSRYTRLAAVR